VSSVNRYDEFAAHYDHLMLGGYYDYAAQAASLARVLPAGCRVLEIGVGTGLLARQLLDRGYAVTGMDHTAEMLDRARALLGPDVHLAEADATDFDLDATFDAVVSNGGVWYGVHDGDGFGYCGHLPHAEGVARSLERVAAHVAPAGRLVLSLQDRHHDKTMSLPDEVRYEQRIRPLETRGPVEVFVKEYAFSRHGELLGSTRLDLAYIDRTWFEDELARHGFGAPVRTDDRQYVVFARD